MTVELKAVNGVRNDVSPERFSNSDLDTGVNVDIDETGKIYRRLAHTQVASGYMHSLYSSSALSYVVKDGVLGTIDKAGAFTAIQTGVANRISYVEIGGEVFWSDNVQTGILTKTTNRKWGMQVPGLPAVAATVGDLRAGTYLYTMTYVRSSGVESGAPLAGSITVNDHAGVSFGNIPVSSDPTVTTKRIYMTTSNGELPYVVAVLPNQTTVTTVTALPTTSMPLRTSVMGPAPAGQVLGYYNGRAYVGSGRFLWYSEPYEYELFNLATGFVALDSTINTFAPVKTGVYVGTETETVFLEGADPLEFVRKQVAPYGTVLGTECFVRNDILLKDGVPGMTPVWMSKTGLCLGTDAGEMVNLTSSRYIIPDASQGASLMKIRSGTPQLVTTLYS